MISPAMAASVKKLTHFDARGAVHMVDVGAKPATHRLAVASGRIAMRSATLAMVAAGTAKKGDVLGVARLAAIQAAKRTPELIPLAHPLALSRVVVDFALERRPSAVRIEVRVECRGPTGVEMEALTAVSVAALTVYDMAKAVDKQMRIAEIVLVEKTKERTV
jgi:cyclic pyranopterin phosphate synthase